MSDVSENYLLDKHGRSILPGDTLKIFHFPGERRKKYFMYKYVEAVECRPSWNGKDALRISHLNHDSENFLKIRDGTQWTDCEIVQGYGPDGDQCYDQRAKIPVTPATPPSTRQP